MNKFESATHNLCDYISDSPTCFHAVKAAADLLKKAGFEQLSESDVWDIAPGKNYYVIRSDSSIIAFCMPEEKPENFRIIASHSDSPSFKIKEAPEIESAGHYIKLNVEKYGGALLSPWFDRPLGIAGRVVIEKDGRIESVLVDSGKDMVMIPSLAIHMDRKANEGTAYKIQSDLLPVYGDETAKNSFADYAAGMAGTDPQKVLGTDLFLYDRSRPSIWGANNEFFSSTRLDDLQCAYSSICAITQFAAAGRTVNGINMCCIFDNEEVGSGTRQGADSTFLQDVLERISCASDISKQEYLSMLASSFLVSADNSHAVHPNHTDKADPVNRPFMNGGVVIKFNASQKYTTDAVSAGIFKTICKNAGIPVQTYFNNSDIPGGSTLGNISTAHISINSVDIGCAQLAMHSPYETSGIKDTYYMINAMSAFYNTDIIMNSDGSYSVNCPDYPDGAFQRCY